MSTPQTLPQEFEEKIKARLGQEFNAFIQSLQQPTPVSVRLNPLKKFSLEQTAPVPWAFHGRYLPERPSFTRDPSFHGGAYYVQEASSMFLEQAIKQAGGKDLKVLDLCAAPGGKSTHLLSLLSPDSLLVSNEVIRSRANILAENIQKWGHHNVLVTNNDPEDFNQLEGFFDIIVVDAPCSGEGLFRKDPGAISEWSCNNVALCSKRQQRILKDVWPALKENGLLIYCTCTYNEQENEDNLQWLQSTYGVEGVKLSIDKSWNIERVIVNNLEGYRFYPHKVAGEGFFLSAIRKTENQRTANLKIKKTALTAPTKIKNQIINWVNSPEGKSFHQWHDIIYFVPGNHSHNIQILLNRLKVVVAGTYLASVKHEKLIPEHALALSNEINIQNFDSLFLTLEDALKYLRKDTLQLVYPKKGFVLTTYNNLPIGWINALGNRLNNLYPKEWRIRMVV